MKQNPLYPDLFALLIALVFPFLAPGQTYTVHGTILDDDTKEPLIGATVQVKGAASGTISDIDGSYTIEVADPQAVLTFSFTGYQPVEVAINGSGQINIQLKPDVRTLSDIVVVGYGVQKKSQSTGAISSIRNEEFRDQPLSNLAANVQGRVSGLNVITPSGTPGAGLIVSVRGSSNPLYVVDGVPMLSESNSALATSFDTDRNAVGKGQNVSSISDINPNDIERIEILKDASAAAIYGARAANGVILITTKRGKEGKTNINFNYYTGLQKVARKIDFMTSEQMVDLIEEARQNDLALYNADNTYFGEDFDPAILTDPLENFNLDGTNTVWLDEVMRTAPISNYEMSLQGGSDKTRFFMSAGYFDQQGIIIENYFRRFNYRLNLDHDVNKRLTIGSNMSASFSRNRRSFNDNTYTGTITNALGASPLMPVYEADGNYAAFEDYQANWLSDNPVKSAKEIKPLTTTYRLLGTAFGEYKLVESLKFRTSFSTDFTQLADHQFLSPITADAEAVGGEALEASFRALTWLNENTLTWQHTAGDHDLTLLGGVTAQRTASESSSVIGQGFPSGSLEKVSSAANIIGATSTGTSFSLLSFIGRVNYGLKNRYLVTASLRADGSSRFSKDNRYGYFPSISVAWRMSEEKFFNKNGLLSDLKVRASYGITGDQEIGDFQNVTFYGPSRYDGGAGIILRNIADPTLSWQSNRVANFGIDYELRDGKFSGSIEVFKSNKSDLLSEDIIPGTTGFATVTRNSGEVENRGVEFNLNSFLVKKQDFKWNLNFNFTYVKNEIKSLTTDGVQLSAYSDLAPTHILQIGQPIGSFWGIQYLGVDPETGDPLYEDLDGNGVIDGDDSQIIGNALPEGFGGLTNSFNWKNFDLTVFLRYSLGNEVYNLIRPTYENMGYGNDGGLSSIYANNSTRVLNRWRKPGDKAEYPRAAFIYQNYYEGSTQFLENGSFLRVQNINLGYTVKNVRWASRLRFYLEAQNACIFSKYKGFDPEVSSTGGAEDQTAGVDYGAYPQARTFLFGINLGF
jgi:TonB-linked SusC/RagA family outer membrane protein